MTTTPSALLKRSGLKDTQTRRSVLEALNGLKKPATPTAVHQWILKKGRTINAVTVYRILDAFERLGLVHRHPCSGNITPCTLPQNPGHHGFLHCTSCGEIKEFVDRDLCAIERRIARSAHFRSQNHINEIIGLCAACA